MPRRDRDLPQGARLTALTTPRRAPAPHVTPTFPPAPDSAPTPAVRARGPTFPPIPTAAAPALASAGWTPTPDISAASTRAVPLPIPPVAPSRTLAARLRPGGAVDPGVAARRTAAWGADALGLSAAGAPCSTSPDAEHVRRTSSASDRAAGRRCADAPAGPARTAHHQRLGLGRRGLRRVPRRSRQRPAASTPPGALDRVVAAGSGGRLGAAAGGRRDRAARRLLDPRAGGGPAGAGAERHPGTVGPDRRGRRGRGRRRGGARCGAAPDRVPGGRRAGRRGRCHLGRPARRAEPRAGAGRRRADRSCRRAADQPVAGPAATAAGGDDRVDLNTADAAALDALPGIGPVLAGRIVAHRDEGPFTSVDELADVAGIGPTLLDRLRELVRV